MKKITQRHRKKILFFLSILVVSALGNFLAHSIIQAESKSAESSPHDLTERLDNIEAGLRDLRYHQTTLEQATKERQQLETALKFHARMKEKTSASQTADSTETKLPTEQPGLVQPAQ